MHDADRLSDYLAELEHGGWDLDQFLVFHPEISETVRCDLWAAVRARSLPTSAPSAAFRARARANFVAAIQTSPPRQPRQPRWYRLGLPVRPWFRRLIAPTAAGLMVLGGTAGVLSVSAAALPETPFYPAKVAIEQIQVLTALTPEQQANAHLSVARSRVQEAAAEAGVGNDTVAQALLEDSDSEIAAARLEVESDSSPLAALYKANVERQVARLESMRATVSAGLVAPPPPRPIAVSAPRLLGDGTSEAIAAVNSVPAAPMSSDERLANEALSVAPPTPVTTPSRVVDLSNALPVTLGVQVAGSQGVASDQPANPTPIPRSGVTVARLPAAAPHHAVTPRISAVPSASPIAAPPVKKSGDDLMRVLVAEAMAGDSTAFSTANQFIQSVVVAGPDGGTTLDALRDDQANLENALRISPPETRPAVQLALSAVDQMVATGGTTASTVPSATSASSAAAPASSPAQSGNPSSSGNRETPPPGGPGSEKKHGGVPGAPHGQPSPPTKTPPPNLGSPKPATAPVTAPVLFHTPSQTSLPSTIVRKLGAPVNPS